MNILRKPKVKKEISPEDLFKSIRKDIAATRRKKTIANTIAIGGISSFAAGATTGTVVGNPMAISLPLVFGGMVSAIAGGVKGFDYEYQKGVLEAHYAYHKAIRAEGLEAKLDMFKRNSLEQNPTKLKGPEMSEI